MQMELNGIYTEIPKKLNTTKNVILTSRDFEILEFILEMRFSGIEEVFEKFFKITQSSVQAKSMEWARKRLSQLEEAKFLKSVRSFSESTRYFTTTFKAYYALSNIKPEVLVCRPSLGFDIRTFYHDKAVLRSRIHLEQKHKVTLWVSDRKLKSAAELTNGLDRLYIPDAIYTSVSGEKVAFELEIAVKAKKRYQDKIKKYVSILRSTDVKHKIFDRVLFVCAKASVAEHLSKETKIYGELFEIQTFDEFFV